MVKPRRVRATDVAKAAGVSPTAVSFVLNGNDAGNVAPSTKKRILEAATELGYEPHHVAKSLRSQTTKSIGFVTDSVATSAFGGRLLAAAIERAQAHDMVLLVIDLLSNDDRATDAIRELERRRVDALVYATMGFQQMVAAPPARLPLILSNCTTKDRKVDSIYPDDALGARNAYQHLRSLGHSRIAMISGTWEPNPDGHDIGNISGPIRKEAFVKAATAEGLNVEVAECNWGIDDGYWAAKRLLDRPTAVRPTAIFAITDRVALGTQLAAASLNLRVPDDVSIIGFDDEDLLANRTVPPLTTIALPHRAMGDAAVSLAIKRAHSSMPDAYVSLPLPCELVVRESTAPPAS